MLRWVGASTTRAVKSDDAWALHGLKWFTSNDSLAATTAFRNGTLQGAYLMIAAHLVGLDVGGMSGFGKGAVG